MFKSVTWFRSHIDFPVGICMCMLSVSDHLRLCASAEVSVPPALYSEWALRCKEVLTGNMKKQPLRKKCSGSHSGVEVE